MEILHVFCFTICLTNYIYADSSATLIRNNLKQIINNALDALVNLEEGEAVPEIDLNARSTMSESSVNEEELSEDVRELERLLLGKTLDDAIKRREESAAFEKEIMNRREKMVKQLDDAMEKREVSSVHLGKNLKDVLERRDGVSRLEKEIIDRRENMKSGMLRKSREEEARVVIDNDNLKDLLDLVVKSIDEDAKMGSSSTKKEVEASSMVKKEVTTKDESKKEVAEKREKTEQKDTTTAASKRDVKKDVKSSENEKKESTKKREMCNTRKKECVQKKKKEVHEETIEDLKKSLDEKSIITKKNVEEKKDDSDEKEIRGMVEKILDGKNESVREALALLVEDVLEKAENGARKREIKH